MASRRKGAGARPAKSSKGSPPTPQAAKLKVARQRAEKRANSAQAEARAAMRAAAAASKAAAKQGKALSKATTKRMAAEVAEAKAKAEHAKAQAAAAVAKQRSEAAQRAAATRAANKAAEKKKAKKAAARKETEAARKKAYSERAQKAAATRRANKTAAQAGNVRNLDDWERTGFWLSPKARPTLFHAGVEYSNRKSGTVRIEYAISIKVPPGVTITKAALNEMLIMYSQTGMQPSGATVRSVSWQHGGGATRSAKPGSTLFEEVQSKLLSRVVGEGSDWRKGGKES